MLVYRTREGRQRWHTIGRHGSAWTPETARAEAQRLLGPVVAGANPFDVLEEATLNAAIAVVASVKATCELEALLATQAAIAAFSAFRMLELSQRHLGEENIAVYGTFAVKLVRVQNELIETINRPRRGNSQSIVVKHVHIHPGAQVVGIINQDETSQGRETKNDGQPMHPGETGHVSQAAPCGAKTRSGAPCKSAPVTGRRRCRMHGGADGSGAPRGNKNGNYKHGRYTEEVAATRRWLRDAAHMIRKLNKGSG
jgi:hypothetical protein